MYCYDHEDGMGCLVLGDSAHACHRMSGFLFLSNYRLLALRKIYNTLGVGEFGSHLAASTVPGVLIFLSTG